MGILGHGVDIVDIQRIERMLNEHGDSFINRCFTQVERAYAEASRGGRCQRYAVRFAAKEAVLKALGTGLTRGINWSDIEIGAEPTGKPVLKLTGQAADIAREMGIGTWHVSLSHSAGLALASVIAST